MTLDERISRALQDPTRRPSPEFTSRVLTALPQQRRRAWSVRGLVAPLAAAGIAVAVLVVGIVDPAIAPSDSAPPERVAPSVAPTAAATPSPNASPAGATYPDGMPQHIEGQPVFRGGAIGRRVAESLDDTSFLIGGYVVEILTDCDFRPDAPSSPLLSPCDSGMHLRDGPLGPGVGPRLVHDGLEVTRGGGPAVFRVHVNDPRARDCAPRIRELCDDAIVVEEIAWIGARTYPRDADGIPREIDDEVVLRGDDISARIRASSDDQQFLIGGWATGQIAYRCAARQAESPAPFERLLACGAPSVLVMDGPDRHDGVVVRAVYDPTLPRPGPVVLRVHVHDALAAQCPGTYTICDETVVLDEVVWTGP